jgi:ABC-type antimicrobial peptide transport system permease subunit
MTAYEKLSEELNVNFISRSNFEEEFISTSADLQETLKSLVAGYIEARDSDNFAISSKVVLTSRFDFILGRIRSESMIYRIPSEEELKQDRFYKNYSSEYDRKMANGVDVVSPIFDFLNDQIRDIVQTNSSSHVKSVDAYFWQYFYDLVYAKKIMRDNGFSEEELDHKTFIESPELVLESFRKYYLSNEFVRIHDRLQQAVEAINFPIFEFIVNVGKRKSTADRNGWVINNFEIMNQGVTYSFSTSAKDEDRVNGPFVDVYIPQYEKRRLYKISAYVSQTLETAYLMNRDLEKITIKNNCQVMIAKHHGNETIVFDTKEEAVKFQEKVMEIRDGRRG